MRILDGNHLAATQRRLKAMRGYPAGPLPRQCLAVLDPALMLITDVIPCEDGHSQARPLIGQVLPLVKPRDVWVADRNFCTPNFLREMAERSAFFVIRWHGNQTVEANGPSWRRRRWKPAG